MATKFTDLSADTPPMFTPFRLRELTLSNRVVMRAADRCSAVPSQVTMPYCVDSLSPDMRGLSP